MQYLEVQNIRAQTLAAVDFTPGKGIKTSFSRLASPGFKDAFTEHLFKVHNEGISYTPNPYTTKVVNSGDEYFLEALQTSLDMLNLDGITIITAIRIGSNPLKLSKFVWES